MPYLSSAANSYIKEVRELSRRRRARKEKRLFIAEGERLCGEIPKRCLKRLFLANSYRGRLPEGFSCQENDSRVFRVPDSLMEMMSDTKTSQGILAVVEMLPERALTGDLFLCLEHMQDPGNLGTIFRTAEAAGVSGIFMDRDCADIYAPKVVRATMGALFRMPFLVVPDLKETVLSLECQGIRSYAAHLHGEKPYFDFSYREPSAFLIGNEGNGLTEELTRACTHTLRIPMRGSTESLNASAAATVLMYEALRQRMRGQLQGAPAAVCTGSGNRGMSAG